MQYRNPHQVILVHEVYAHNLDRQLYMVILDGGLDIVDNSYLFELKQENFCPNILNEE